MFCRNCGSDVTNMKYCPKCGTYAETGNAGAFDTESHLAKKEFTIQKASGLSFSVVLTAWGLLLITDSLFPYIMCQIMYDFSDYDSLGWIYLLSYFVFSVIACVKFHKFIKAMGYIKTSQYKLTDALAVNRSTGLQMVILGIFIWWAMVNKRKISNGDLWNISIIVLVLCGVMWAWWIFSFKKIRHEDRPMILTTIYISFREFWVSFALFGIADALMSLCSSVTVLGLILIALIFVYPAVRFRQTKRILAKVFHIK